MHQPAPRPRATWQKVSHEFCPMLRAALRRPACASRSSGVRWCSAKASTVVIHREGPELDIAQIQLKAKPVNSLSTATCIELTEAIRELEADPDVRGLVLGSGIPNMFSAGLDIKEMLKPPDDLAKFWTAVQARTSASGSEPPRARQGRPPAHAARAGDVARALPHTTCYRRRHLRPRPRWRLHARDGVRLARDGRRQVHDRSQRGAAVVVGRRWCCGPAALADCRWGACASHRRRSV